MAEGGGRRYPYHKSFGRGSGRGYTSPQISEGGGYPDPQITAGGRGIQHLYPQLPSVGGGEGGYYDHTNELQMMVENYKTMASSLIMWLNSSLNWIMEIRIPTALIRIKAVLTNVARFQADEIPTWRMKKTEILRFYDSLKKYGAHLLIKDASIQPDNINLIWRLLESALHEKVLDIKRREGQIRIFENDGATWTPPPGPSANKALMTAQYLQTYNRTKMVDTTTGAFQHVRFCFQWIIDKQAILDGAGFGKSMYSVKQALDLNEKEHEKIISFMTEVDRCVTDRDKLTLEQQQPYEECLSHVQVMYPVLLGNSHQYLEQLKSLLEFLHKATVELDWMAKKQALIYDFGQRLDEFSISDEQTYKTLMQEITNRKSHIRSLEGRGRKLINDNHPATETVEVHISRTQSGWSWLHQLMNCMEKHIAYIGAYHKFFQEVESCEKWINQKIETVNNCMKLEKISFEGLQEMKIECQDLQNALVKYEERVPLLAKTSHGIIPLKQWNRQVTSPIKVYSLCISEHLKLNEEYFLQNTSKKSHWDVTNSHGQQITVPSICLMIPAPDPEAVHHSDRLKNSLDQLKILIRTYDRKLTENIVKSTIKFIQGWNCGKFQSLGQIICEVIVRDLNYEAARLMTAVDQMMQLQLKKDLDECNNKVQRFSKKLSEEGATENNTGGCNRHYPYKMMGTGYKSGGTGCSRQDASLTHDTGQSSKDMIGGMQFPSNTGSLEQFPEALIPAATGVTIHVKGESSHFSLIDMQPGCVERFQRNGTDVITDIEKKCIVTIGKSDSEQYQICGETKDEAETLMKKKVSVSEFKVEEPSASQDGNLFLGDAEETCIIKIEDKKKHTLQWENKPFYYDGWCQLQENKRNKRITLVIGRLCDLETKMVVIPSNRCFYPVKDFGECFKGERDVIMERCILQLSKCSQYKKLPLWVTFFNDNTGSLPYSIICHAVLVDRLNGEQKDRKQKEQAKKSLKGVYKLILEKAKNVKSLAIPLCDYRGPSVDDQIYAVKKTIKHYLTEPCCKDTHLDEIVLCVTKEQEANLVQKMMEVLSSQLIGINLHRHDFDVSKKVEEKIDPDDSSDDSQSVICGSDFYDPEDLVAENIIGLNSQDGQMPISRNADRALAIATDTAVAPTAGGTVAPTADVTVTHTAEKEMDYSQSILYGSDFYDSNVKMMDVNIIGLNLLDCPMPISRKGDGTVTHTDGTVTPTTGST